MFKTAKQFYKRHNNSILFILVCLVLFWPLGIYLLWKHRKWSLKTRKIVTVVCIIFTLFVGVADYNAPPSITLHNESIASYYTTDDDYMLIYLVFSMLQSLWIIMRHERYSTRYFQSV